MSEFDDKSLARARDELLARLGVRPDASWDAVADVRAMRDEDNEVSDHNFARRLAEANARPPEVVAARGQALLDALGLTASAGDPNSAR